MSDCTCGHPFAHHHIVKGFTASPGTAFSVNGGPSFTEYPDVWVCSGDHEPVTLKDGESPWDHVCGCVLHERPPLTLVRDPQKETT